jgi:hypothetical protein
MKPGDGVDEGLENHFLKQKRGFSSFDEILSRNMTRAVLTHRQGRHLRKVIDF